MKRSTLYSPHHPSVYTTEYDGVMDGIGAHPAFTNNLGAWNIFWLSSSLMDLYLTKQDCETPELPYSSSILPAAVGTSYQHLSDGNTIGNLTLELDPRTWLKTLRADAWFSETILYQIYKESWINKVEERIVEYEMKSKANIINVNFRRVA